MSAPPRPHGRVPASLRALLLLAVVVAAGSTWWASVGAAQTSPDDPDPTPGAELVPTPGPGVREAEEPVGDLTDAADEAAGDSLTLPKAIVLGLVEGVTEYLPVSSTGHLLVVERLLDVGTTDADKAATDTFTIAVQIGAILAVLGIYRQRVVVMAEGLLGRSRQGRDVLVALLVAFVPAGAAAFLFGDPIKERLLAPWPVVISWAVGGVAILAFVRHQDRLTTVRTPTLDAITLRQAAIIGAAQVLALWPGTSRSLVTLLAGLLVGLSLQVAVEFAFLLGLVTLGTATVYELVANGSELFDTFGVVGPLVGTMVAGLAAFASVRWMVAYLERHPLSVFGWYRLGVATVVAGLLVTDVI